MVSLNVTFSDDEMDRVRDAAKRHGLALKPYAREAILAAADAHAERVDEAFRYVTDRSAELNERLA